MNFILNNIEYKLLIKKYLQNSINLLIGHKNPK